MQPVTREQLEAVKAPEATIVVYAEHQPQYVPLPVVTFQDGVVFSEWTPTPEELAKLASGNPVRIRLWQWTFLQPLQPVAVELV